MATGNTADLDFSDLTGESRGEAGNDGEEDSAAHNEDICRVCRVGSLPGRPLFHPCVCTGSIRYIHQDCLIQWLRHSRKEFCELCMHRFEFVPIYRPDTPRRLPVSELVGGLVRGALKNLRHWLHLGFVAFVWLVIVPICIYRIYSFLLYGSLWSIAHFPLQLFSLENLLLDDVYGLLIVFVSLLGFISMVWLKDQLGNGGAPHWLARDQHEVNQLRMREVQDQANVMRHQPEEGGQRNVPERAAVALELAQLHHMLDLELERFGALEDESNHRYERELDLLRAQQRNLLTFHSSRSSDTDTMSDSQNYEHSFSAPSTSDSSPASLAPAVSDWPERLVRYRRTVPQATPRDGVDELTDVQSQIEKLRDEQRQYQRVIQQFMELTDRAVDDADADDADTAVEPLLESEWISEREKTALIKIWETKEKIRAATQREQEMIEQQDNEERVQRDVQRDRWFNRILNRRQEPADENVERRDPPRPPRPNIVPALAGLARDQPPDGANGPAQDIVEELTWARLLGLDGSFRFLEHVLWLICLNSALIITFGYFAAVLFQLWDILGIKAWRGVFSTLLGYILATVFITAVYYFTGMLRLPRLKSVLGMAYVGIKVGLILAVEAGVFPLMCGWWIDICSFALFGSTMKSRQASLSSAPGTVMFIHWLVGMIFIFYLASFVMLMREVVRPGVLWFLRNLNDQNFHPIHEMIGLPLQRHLKRFIMSCIMFGVCVVVILLLPSRLILLIGRDFLPYRLSLSSSFSPIREVQLELILLQFVIPTLLEHGNCRTGLKVLITSWAKFSARVFGLQSYLLDKHQSKGNVVDLHGNVIPDAPVNPDPSGPVYTGPTQVLGPGFAPFKPYLRPPLFHLRITGFLLFTLAATITFSCLLFVLPVAIGRLLMSLFGVSQVPEIYTAAVGLYTLWLVIRFGSTVASYIMQGTEILLEQMKLWSLQGVKCVIAAFLLFVVIPLLLGHLVDLLLISPLRVPRNRTPVFYPSTEWALGLLHTKCMCGAIWLTNISFKTKLDRVYQDGLRSLNLTFVVRDVAWPVIAPLSLFITVPYVVCMGVLPGLELVPVTTSLLAYRYFFPSVLVLLLIIASIVFVAKQLRRLYTHIKNEKYLVGRQLVNYGSTETPLEEKEYSVPVQETH